MIEPQFGFVLEYVKDIEAAKRFYVEVLGLKMERYHPTFIQFRHFAVANDESMTGNRDPELYWLVDDAEAAFTELLERADVSLPLKQMPFGNVFGIENPDGRSCYVLEPARHRPSQPTPEHAAASLKSSQLERLSPDFTNWDRTTNSHNLDGLVRTANLQWTPLVESGVDTGGISVKCLRRDQVSGRAPSFLLRFEPGAKYPYHNHPAGEELFVLAGSCVIEGATLDAGDYLYTAAGSKHSVRTDTGCTLLFQVPEEVEIL